jgi:hypothetical protein
LTFFEDIFESEVVIISLFFGIISIVQAVSQKKFLSLAMKKQAKVSAWYMFVLVSLTGIVIIFQEYFSEGLVTGISTFQFGWVYGSISAFIFLALLIIGLGLILQISLTLLEKALQEQPAQIPSSSNPS